MDDSQTALAARLSFRGWLLVALAMAMAMALIVLTFIWYTDQQQATILYDCYGTAQWEVCTTPPP